MWLVAVCHDGQVDTRLPPGIEFVRNLGAGAQGEVVQAWDANLARRVAVKRIRQGSRHPEYDTQLLLAEGRSLAQVRSRYTACVYDMLVDAGPGRVDAWMIMEYVPGPSLDSVTKVGGRMTTPTLLLVLRHMSLALAAISQRGIVHRDVKPGNIISGGDRYCLVDFGVATLSQSGVREQAGTPKYMAPEVAGEQPATPASDVYSLGVAAWQLAAGRHPFSEMATTASDYLWAAQRHEIPSLRKAGCRVPGRLSRLVSSMTNPNPAKRPPAEGVARATGRLL